MAKLRIEFQIMLLAVIIATAVIATGYLAYKSLSKIVNTVQQEANPDYQLFLIKDIAADLANLENVVRLYVLTNDEQNLAPYMELNNRVTERLNDLKITSSSEYSVLVNNFYKLAVEKLQIWQDVLNLHKSSRGMDTGFTRIYSKLEYTDVDTVITETKERGFLGGLFGKEKVMVDTLPADPEIDTIASETKQRGFLKGIFGGVNKVKTDTILVEKNLERTEIKDEIQNLESLITAKDAQINILESKLIERNGEIGEKLNQLILRRENFEAENRLIKTAEADQLAQLTYKRMAAFSAAAMLLLLVVIFMLFNYQRKSRSYQRALQNAKLEAERLASAKEQFAANVSHELRTPVNAIYSLSEQLHQQSGEGQIKNQLAILASSASHLRSIINDTLDFSKIQTKKLKIDSVHFSPVSVFEEVINIQNIEAAKKGISLKYNPVHPLPDALIGDPLRLKQILINLVGNAIKFTETGEVVLEVRSTNETEDKVNLDFFVKDTGIGISAENIDSIFDEFVQLENVGGKKYSGTGLGLSIVKKLVEMQDGKITLESEPNKGTVVFVSIPCLKGDPEQIELNESVIPDIPENFRSSSVLIADDEEFNRYVIKNIFNKWGVRYDEAADGEEAVKMALVKKYDIILLDVRMPRKNGFEAAREIIKADPEATIVSVTASDRKVDREACIKAGMKNFLLKPFSENDLFNVLFPLYNHSITIRQEQSDIDPDELEKLGNGDPQFLKEMILLFIKTTEEGLCKIKEAVDAKDLETITETAHRMAAPSKHINAHDLYEKLKKLEYAPHSMDPQIINDLYTEVKEEAGKVIEFLKRFVQEMQE
jgi:signal transduction histidine kinase/FixJ family two-component response regulator